MPVYQVKINLKNENNKFKAQVLSGVVIAESQQKAVSIAMENTKKEIVKQDLKLSAKLLSAHVLGSQFIYFQQAEAEPEEEVKK
jgi:hypothetical protein